MSDRFLKLPEVKAITTWSTSKIYRDMDSGLFPKSIKLGPKSVAWLESEVQDWIKRQVAQSRTA